jgi:hypothetical protein
MRSRLGWSFATVAILAATFASEWRYSDEMREHIELVNHDLDTARLQITMATGVIGSLEALTAETDVAREIMETPEHVHTIKDDVLARKIKKAAEQGVTVGGAIQNVIASWPESSK